MPCCWEFYKLFSNDVSCHYGYRYIDNEISFVPLKYAVSDGLTN
jgi:hypothetical protein